MCGTYSFLFYVCMYVGYDSRDFYEIKIRQEKDKYIFAFS